MSRKNWKVCGAAAAATAAVVSALSPCLAWADNHYQLEALHRTGDTVLGQVLDIIESDDYSVHLNDQGQMLFLSTNVGAEQAYGLYRKDIHTGTVSLVARELTPHAGENLAYISHDSPRLNNNGDIIFRGGRLLNPGGFNPGMLFKNDSVHVAIGEVVAGRTIDFISEAMMDINDAGDVMWFGLYNNQMTEGLFKNREHVVSVGEMFGGRQIENIPQDSYVDINNAGEFTFTARTGSDLNNKTLFKVSATGSVSVVAERLTTLPQGGFIDNLLEDSARINNAGTVAYIAELESGSGQPSDAVIVGGNVVLRDGDQHAGITIQSIAQTDGLAFNDLGQYIVQASEQDGSQFGRQVLLTNDGVIARVGDEIGGWTLTGIGDEAMTINNRGEIIFAGYFDDGTGTFLYGHVLARPSVPTWGIDASGNWSDPAHWQGSLPNGAGAVAQFSFAATGPRTVTVDQPVTVGQMIFKNANRYTIAGGSAITIESSSAQAAEILVREGSHTISAPLVVNSDLVLNVIPPDATLTLSGNLSFAPAVGLSKIGPGTAVVPNVRAESLAIDEGVVKVTPSASAGGTSRVRSLEVASGAAFDLSNNALVIDYDAASPLAEIRTFVLAGYNDGAWDGTGGINSSSAAHVNTHAVGYAEASALGAIPAIFGSGIDSTAVLVRHTRYGDATLDGVVNLADFNVLAANFGGSGKQWFHADFNYDGLVNLADFNILASSFGLSAGPDGVVDPSDWAALAAAVPEPATATWTALALGSLALRRRARFSGRVSRSYV